MSPLHPSVPPGTLYFTRAQPNPDGARDAAVYLIWGDTTAAPVTEIVPADDVRLPPSMFPSARAMRLKVLHFNDLHGHISGPAGELSMLGAVPGPMRNRLPGVKAFAGRAVDARNRLKPRIHNGWRSETGHSPRRLFSGQGTNHHFSRIAGWLRATRARYADDPQVAVLAVSGGDESSGAIFDELLGHDPETYQLHAGYRLCSQAGIDAGVLGNHDFDRGTALLAHAIRQDVRFPLLAANLTGCQALAGCCAAAAIFVLKGLRVGFIGLITPAETYPEPGAPWRIADPVATARNLIPAFRPLCDVLIVLSHLGYSLGERGAITRSAGDVELARGLPPGTVDLIVGGHTHNALNENGLSAENIVNGIPIVQAGKFGQFVGEVDLVVGETAVVTHAQLTATTDLPCDAAFEREHVEPLLAQVRPYRERILGRVAADADLSTDAVRNAFASGESALANFIADALVARTRACGCPVDLAMIDASVVCCGLTPGADLSFGAWFNLMPFADTVCLLQLSGRQIDALLQDNALRIDRPAEHHTQRGFLHFSGALRYAIELGETRDQARAEAILVNGEPLEGCLDRILTVAASSFVRGLAAAWEAHGQGDLPPLFDLQGAPVARTRLYVRDLLVDHITATGGVLPQGGARRDGRLRVVSRVPGDCKSRQPLQSRPAPTGS